MNDDDLQGPCMQSSSCKRGFPHPDAAGRSGRRSGRVKSAKSRGSKERSQLSHRGLQMDNCRCMPKLGASILLVTLVIDENDHYNHYIEFLLGQQQQQPRSAISTGGSPGQTWIDRTNMRPLQHASPAISFFSDVNYLDRFPQLDREPQRMRFRKEAALQAVRLDSINTL